MGNSLSLQEIRAIQKIYPERWEQVFAMLQSLDEKAKRLKMKEIFKSQAEPPEERLAYG